MRENRQPTEHVPGHSPYKYYSHNQTKTKKGDELMMIPRTVSLLLLVALSACASLQSTKSCPSWPSGPPKLVPININYNSNGIVVAPPKACARPGDVLRFKIFGAANVPVTVNGKAPADAWVKGSGKNKWFYVIVPHDLLPDDVDEKTYNYKVSATGSPDLDPEVRIRRLN